MTVTSLTIIGVVYSKQPVARDMDPSFFSAALIKSLSIDTLSDAILYLCEAIKQPFPLVVQAP